MPKQVYRKLDIAHDYLAAAAEHYFAERYFPAISLAAMAEEIFEAVMNARNKGMAQVLFDLIRATDYRPISKELIALARKVDPDVKGLTDGAIRALLYRVKNSAKHGMTWDRKGFDLEIECDPELEAWQMLVRAMRNLIGLHYPPKGAVLKFFRIYEAGRKTWHEKGSSEGPQAKPYTIPTQEPSK